MNTNNLPKNVDIDSVLKVLGDFGAFQIVNYILISFPVLLVGAYSLSYVFTAGQLDYRCKISECDNNDTSYQTNWLPYAIPHIPNGNPYRCQKYVYHRFENHNSSDEFGQFCSAEDFDTSQVIGCDEFIYKNDEVTIVNEFNLTCKENDWKLSMVGSANSAAQFIFTPIAGYVSDVYGRRFILVLSLILSGIFGILRSFATSYEMFLSMEFLEAGFGSGIYSAALVLGMELVQTNRRMFIGTLIALDNSFGGAILGLLAMYTKNFRLLLRYIYIPAFAAVIYPWLVPESIRWLMIHGKSDQVNKVINKAASMNKITIPVENIKLLDYNLSDKSVGNRNLLNGTESEKKSIEQKESIFSSPILMLRIAICSFCWMTNTFIFYGMSLNAVSFDGDKYLNFIAVILAEIPSIFVTYLLIDRFGRRLPFCISMIICGVCCLGSAIVPHQIPYIGHCLYIVGKCGVTISFTILYLYTAEMFPTTLRHTLLSFCSMIGRIGTIIAPQTPLLNRYMESLPLLMFASTALVAAILSLNFPETLNTKLPDTIKESERIHYKRNKLSLNVNLDI